MLCVGKLKNGNPCRFKAKQDNLCLVHFKKIEKEVSEEEPEEEPEPVCPICLCDLDKKKENITIGCKHTFHKTCLKTWLQKKITCPNCRVDIDGDVFDKLKIDKTLNVLKLVENSFKYDTQLFNDLYPISQRYSHAIEQIIYFLHIESNAREELKNYIKRRKPDIAEIYSTEILIDLEILNDLIRELKTFQPYNVPTKHKTNRLAAISKQYIKFIKYEHTIL